MLRISAEIGDKFLVTFVKSGARIASEQRINHRRAFLDRRSARIRPGDKCLVVIVGENKRKTAYTLNVVAISRGGDGESSLLQKMRQAVDCGDRSTARALKIAERYLGGDKSALLESLLDLLESYEAEPNDDEENLDYEAICHRAEEISSECCNSGEKIRMYSLMGECCMGRGSDTHLANELLQKALTLADQKEPSLAREVLVSLDRLASISGLRDDAIDIKKRLLKLDAARMDVQLRLKLAQLELERFIDEGGVPNAERWSPGKVQEIPEMVEIRALLLPVVNDEKFQRTDCWNEAAKRLGDSFFYEHRYAEALTFYQHVKHTFNLGALRTYADALYGSGRMKEAMEAYRAAFFKAEKATGD